MKLLIAAGGTGGHILPGIRIGRALENQAGENNRVVYLCGEKEIEERIYRGEEMAPRVLRGRFYRGNLLCRLASSLLALPRVCGIFSKEKPDAVLAMGGAVCLPVLLCARIAGLPIFLHESNSVRGRVTRMFSPHARRVYLGLDTGNRPNEVQLGTPSGAVIEADSRRVVLCLGGSQGAIALNDAFVKAGNLLGPLFPDYRFLLVCGPGKSPENPAAVEVREYVANLPELLAQTCVAVSRAGAGTLADLANFRIPSILVPYPAAMDNHQDRNARIVTDGGGALLLTESEMSGEIMAKLLKDLLSDGGRRDEMMGALAKFDSSQSAQLIVDDMLRELSRGKVSRPSPEREGIGHASH